MFGSSQIADGGVVMSLLVEIFGITDLVILALFVAMYLGVLGAFIYVVRDCEKYSP